jgi:hypothetical protein
MNKSMLLVTSSWGQFKTFKMIPISKECPYNECIYDVQSKVLAIIGKESKESFHMLPKLTDQGDVQYLKIGKRNNGKDYAEERKALVTLYEYYVEDVEEVKNFVSMFSVNSDTFNIQQYIDLNVDVKPTTAPAQGNIITGV